VNIRCDGAILFALIEISPTVLIEY